MKEIEELISGCNGGDRLCQELLYRKFAPKMFGICMRFAKNKVEAEDILQDGFIKVFINLKSFRNECHIEGWIRRIIVNTAINHYKKKSPTLNDLDLELSDVPFYGDYSPMQNLNKQELLKYIKELPKGYRMVFNLNAIEGYSHKEISEMLKISINTSKSQLARARKALQQKIRSNAVTRSNYEAYKQNENQQYAVA